MSCDECGGKLALDEKHNEMVCTQCGAVGTETLEPPRAHPDPHSLLAKEASIAGLGSSMHFVDRDGKGNALSPSEQRRAVSLRRTHEIMSGSFTRNRRRTERVIQEVADVFQAPDWTVADATALHHRVLEHRFESFPKRRVLAAALVVSAMRGRGLPLPLQQAAEQAGIRFRDLVDALKRLRRLVPEARVAANIPALAQHFTVRLGHPQFGHDAWQVALHLPAVNQNPIAVAAAACLVALRRNEVRVTTAQVARLAGLREGHVHGCMPDLETGRAPL